MTYFKKLKDAGNLAHFLSYLFIVLLLLATGILVATRINGGVRVAPSADMGLAMIIAYLVFPLIFVAHLLLLRRFVEKSMGATSSKDEAPDREDDPGEPTSVELQVVEFDYQEINWEAEHLREELISRNAADLWRTWPLLFLACISYWALPLLLDEKPYFRQEENESLIHWVVIYFLIITIGPIFYRGKFRAKGREFLMNPSPYTGVLKAVFNPTYYVYLGLGFVFLFLLLSISPAGRTTGMYLAIFTHLGIILFLWAYPRIKPYAGLNVKLLVLRIFKSSDDAIFTFDRLIPFWRLFGTHMTIDSKDYAQHRYRFWQGRTGWLFLGVLLLGGLWYMSFALLTIIVARDWILLFRSRPAGDTNQIRKRINNVLSNPRPSGIFFRDLRMICFDNTWKIAVPEFMKQTDVVLMDLRAFTPENKGINWEVNYILDHIALDRIIFLRDDKKSDKKAIHDFIKRGWIKLEKESPNWSLKRPIARLFVMGEGLGDDVQALMDALLAAALLGGLTDTMQSVANDPE